MKLKEAMQYRGETAESLGRRMRVTEQTVEGWMRDGGLDRLSAARLREIAAALDGGVLVTEDGCEVELYGGCNERGKTDQQETV